MNRFATTIIYLILASTTCARLGETLGQCEKRYGPELERKSPSLGEAQYYKGGFLISAKLDAKLAGNVELLTFTKVDPKNLKRAVAMSEAEKSTLMRANSGGSEFIKTSENQWRTKDKKHYATYSTETNTLIFFHSNYLNRLQEDSKSEVENRLKDF